MAKRRFEVNRMGKSTYKCVSCGKLTRDTGEGEGGVSLCRRCYEIGGWVNSIFDGDCTIDDVPEEYRAEVAREVGE